MMGKQHRTAYPKEIPYRTTQPFEIVHSDVCPMHVNSHGNSKYFVTFVNDYSRYVHIYFIKSKDEVLEKLKEFANYTANTTGKKAKVLRSENGGEYLHQTTAPYNRAQNGVAVRMNRTLLETSLSMMAHSKVPFEFWAEAINTAVYLRNRSPTTALKGKTPFEKLFKPKSIWMQIIRAHS